MSASGDKAESGDLWLEWSAVQTDTGSSRKAGQVQHDENILGGMHSGLLEGNLGASEAGSLARAFSSGAAAEDASSRSLIARCSPPWRRPYSTRLTDVSSSVQILKSTSPSRLASFFCASKVAASSERNRSWWPMAAIARDGPWRHALPGPRSGRKLSADGRGRPRLGLEISALRSLEVKTSCGKI